MKKVLASILAVGCFAAAGTAIAGIGATTGVNGSLHDMNMIANSTTDSMGRVCAFCHTPHHANTGTGTQKLPLWNHAVTDVDQFTPYAWATPLNHGDNNEFDITDVVQGPSRLCMSCHDGSIAIDQHGEAFSQGATGAGGLHIGSVATDASRTGRANLTTNLSDTHPIGFNYNLIAAYRNLKAQNGSADADGASVGTEIVTSNYGYATKVVIHDQQSEGYNEVTRGDRGGKLIQDNLYMGDYMTCATCHEVHNKENVKQKDYTDGQKRNVVLKGGTVQQSAPNYFLYAQQDQSLICLSCHVK